MPAAGTAKTVGPAQRKEIVAAGLLAGEARLELELVARVILHKAAYYILGHLSQVDTQLAEYLQEFPTGQPSQVSLIQGISYRLRPDLVLDFSLQQNGLAATPFDLIFATGLTYNLGRLF